MFTGIDNQSKNGILTTVMAQCRLYNVWVNQTMKIKKNTIMTITTTRKGTFDAIASEDFDTNDEWWKINLHQKERVKEMSHERQTYEGDPIACRKCFVTSFFVRN